jgi:hypothetical protein
LEIPSKSPIWNHTLAKFSASIGTLCFFEPVPHEIGGLQLGDLFKESTALDNGLTIIDQVSMILYGSKMEQSGFSPQDPDRI